MKRLSCLVILFVCTIGFAMAAGQADQGSSASAGGSKSGKLFDAPTKITMFTNSNSSWPYDSDWWVVRAAEEATNAELEVTAVAENYNDKFNVIMASGNLPDIMFVTQALANRYYDQGPFAAIDDHMATLPNISKLSAVNEVFSGKLTLFRMPDGKTYLFPQLGIEGIVRKRGWLARLDILEKHGLEVPTTDAELYDVLQALKSAYPDSYPFSFRSGIGQFNTIAPQYGVESTAYYDFDAGEWKYGPVTDGYRELVTFYKSLYDAELIPTDFLSMSTKAWTDLVSTSRAFFTVDYTNRMDYFNGPMRGENPDTNLQWIAPPAGGTNGVQEFKKAGFIDKGAVVCNTRNVDAALAFTDWMYSDEASVLLSWGREGETFRTENGKRQYIGTEDGTRVEVLYGFLAEGVSLRIEPDAAANAFSEEVQIAMEESERYDQKNYNPYDWLSLKPEESELRSTIGEAIDRHAQENISLFIIGKRDMDEWDEYVAEIEKLGLEQYLEIFETAYDRVK